jgi:sugar (pentulose or hexulose) kinase
VSKHKLLATRAASTCGNAKFTIEGSVFVAGAAVQWLRDQLGLIASAAESEVVAATVTGNDGVYLVPSFVGLGAPHWDSGARELLTGITPSTSRAQRGEIFLLGQYLGFERLQPGGQRHPNDPRLFPAQSAERQDLARAARHH